MAEIHSDHIDFIRDVLFRAGDISLRGLGKNPEKTDKGAGAYDFATEYDLKLQEYIRSRIEREYGDILLAEEEDAQSASPLAIRAAERLWVVDPIDGTFNYRKGIPLYGVSVAVCSERQPVAGGIRFPALGETFLASHNSGAVLESDRIRDSRTLQTPRRLPEEDLLVSVEGRGAPDIIETIYRENNPNSSFRSWFCATASLAFLAAGRVDACVCSSVFPWDIAAGDLLLREAGGFSCDGKGGPIFPRCLDQWLEGHRKPLFYVGVTGREVWEARLRNVLDRCGAVRV